jgi:hypothetical protein
MQAHITLLLLAAVVVGCAYSDGQQRWDGSVETLPGGVVRITNGEQGLWRAGEEWRLVPELNIGRLDGEGADVFNSISGLVVDGDGRIYVLDRQASELRIFDATGAHVRTVGRSGEGPGEYSAANGLEWLAPDTLIVADARGNRYTVLSRDGDFVRTMQRPLNFFGWITNGGVHDRRFIEVGTVYRSADDYTPAFFVMHVGDAITGSDTLPSPFPGPGQSRYPSLSVQTDRGGMSMSTPFAPAPVWHLNDDGSIWYGYSDDYRLLHLTLEGDTLREVLAPAAPLPVLSSELDDWESTDGVQRFREMGGRIDRSALPRTKPVFRAVTTDQYGNLWVEVLDADGLTEFDIFDADGRRLGRLATGIRRVQWVKPRLRNDRLYLVATDDLGVERVLAFRVEVPAG